MEEHTDQKPGLTKWKKGQSESSDKSETTDSEHLCKE